ncbi:MAG: helix-turn-helix transcriptional regulator [Fluviicoccus sp.]|uniref:helix-turn-helix domain-containing protein n=1 Tax=Fluviicoccus sp. TaxID=2003552 RepID=UPI00272276D6|nr:helix-turn-helix transcriptional regulator [Fluviicoccus sp.]MDO8330322.1 helix-turn-helix transcriptional regulator [Fluviicoccus sp.]
MTDSIHSEEMIALRAWLRTARENHGWSMRDLAAKLGKAHNYVQRVEDGDRRLDVVEFVRYCEALVIDPADGLALVLTARQGLEACQSNDS